MGEICYAPLIDDMTWSYSRVKAFVDCPHRFYLRYICGLQGKDLFFASYGTFIHRLLALYYSGEKTAGEITDLYLADLLSSIPGSAPKAQIFSDYFAAGLNCVQDPPVLPYKPAAIEKKVSFQIGSLPMVGYIDYVGQRNDTYAIVDHKSRKLSPRSQRQKPTVKDKELDEYLVQLYLYAASLEQEIGILPEELCFNCFRSGLLIRERFDPYAYRAAQDWLCSWVSRIREESDFPPSMDFFRCQYLCEMQDECMYFGLNFRS